MLNTASQQRPVDVRYVDIRKWNCWIKNIRARTLFCINETTSWMAKFFSVLN